MAHLSAFADEMSEDFLTQCKYLAGQRVGYIEPRFVNRKNILDLSQGELKETKEIILDSGLKVSAIGSPIGKIKLDDPWKAHLDKFKHCVDVAVFLGTPYIRMFSYYAAKGKVIIDNCLPRVLWRMRKKLAVLEDVDVTMVHENEAKIFGHTAENCARLVTELGSDKFRLVYDPANFVWGEGITNNVEVCWPVMKPHVVHIHIKDWKLGSVDVGSIPGEGDGQIRELLKELAEMNYDGCLTMEPHLQEGGQFGGSTSPEQFSKAIEAVQEIAADVGLPLT